MSKKSNGKPARPNDPAQQRRRRCETLNSQKPGSRPPSAAATDYAAFRDRLSTRPSAVSLLQPFQPALATDYILVVPLDVSSFCQPALEILPVDLIGRSVAGFGGFEATFLFQPFFLKRLTAPKEKTHAFLQLAVPDHGVAIQKPHRVGVPYFVFRLWQNLIDLPSQQLTDGPILRTEGLVVIDGVGVHNCFPSGGARLFLSGLMASQENGTAVDRRQKNPPMSSKKSTQLLR